MMAFMTLFTSLQYSTSRRLINLFTFSIFAFAAPNIGAQASVVDCSDSEAALEFWRPIRAAASDDNYSANELAPALVECLGSENSELRDGIGYELFTYWLRNEKLSSESKLDLLNSLSENLTLSDEAHSLQRSFSALVLSELLRADNLSSFMADEDREMLLQTTVNAMAIETDFRGFDDNLGWVHPIAHLADVLWRFSLHSALSAQQAQLILNAVRSKAVTSESAYITNEGDRLARSVTVLITRNLLPAAEFASWLRSFETSQSGSAWSNSFTSNQGMIELHNTKLFIRALINQLQDQAMEDAVRVKLNQLAATFAATV